MKPRVYVETSVVSYLTAPPSRDIVVGGRQQVTREGWAIAPARFELVISRLVLQEAEAGDPNAARGAAGRARSGRAAGGGDGRCW